MLAHSALEPSTLETQKQLEPNQQSSLRALLENGLPIIEKPFRFLAEKIGTSEELVLAQIQQWQSEGLVKRFGIVVKHRQLGYVANAMVVWNIPDEEVDNVAGKLSKCNEVSLCYRRPRRLPEWPYNLFCMIHGKSREKVEEQIAQITEQLSLSHIQKDILFSNKAYKQNGARYSRRTAKP